MSFLPTLHSIWKCTLSPRQIVARGIAAMVMVLVVQSVAFIGIASAQDYDSMDAHGVKSDADCNWNTSSLDYGSVCLSTDELPEQPGLRSSNDHNAGSEKRVSSETINASADTFGNILYIYEQDADLANTFRDFFAAEGFTVTLSSLAEANISALPDYDAILIAADTGVTSSWPVGDPALGLLAAYIEGSGTPIFGLGEGGYAYFGKMGSSIGWPHGWRREQSAIEPNELSSTVWQTPYNFGTPPDPLVLYSADIEQVSVYAINLPDVLMVGRETDDDEHAPIAVQLDDCYTLWGFSAGPAQMTAEGKQLIVNTLVYGMGLECDLQKMIQYLYLPALLK